MSLLFLGDAPLCLLERLGIDLTALELHAAPKGSDTGRAAPQTWIDYQAARRDEGFEKMNRFVQTLLPVVMALIDSASLEDIPDRLWEPAGPLAENQERLPCVDDPFVVDATLPMVMNDRQAPRRLVSGNLPKH